MTPDQDLKAALLGDATPRIAKPAKSRRAPRHRPSRKVRWSVKLLMLALTLMVTRGLMQTPEAKVMWGDIKTAVISFAEQERAARRMAEAGAQVDRMQGIEATGSAMPESRVALRRVVTPDARVLSGPVEEVFAGNAVMVAGVPVVIDSLTCAAPGSERAAREIHRVRELTQSRTLRCTVSGSAGPEAVTANCALQGAGDLANAMLAGQHCQASPT